ncbi:hypothetical protein TrVE_jg2053 [Triparma verrucosa]|uniref:Uncharacterized protein n=1 Tax=Triparma verrucosa TaxID=1606542 RepID=A0A9W7EX82_9STRA|nr:hypothetical protein TrVE_jg2053 [Triparma verrucosa]
MPQSQSSTYPFPPASPSQSPVPISDLFFDLANASTVSISSYKISQNNEIEDSTGGVVWESSYLLYDYLSASLKEEDRTLAVISDGPGLLSMCLSTFFTSVIATEIGSVVPLLSCNISSNNLSSKVTVTPHDWTVPWSSPRSSLVLTTDTLFSSSLVIPLLSTLKSALLPHGTVYICSQERCLDSIAKLITEGPEYFDDFREVSEEVWEVVDWGREVGGRVWRGRGKADVKLKKRKKEKREKKQKKEKKHKKNEP